MKSDILTALMCSDKCFSIENKETGESSFIMVGASILLYTAFGLTNFRFVAYFTKTYPKKGPKDIVFNIRDDSGDLDIMVNGYYEGFVCKDGLISVAFPGDYNYQNSIYTKLKDMPYLRLKVVK